MAENPQFELKVEPGIWTEVTAREAKGYFKDSEKIRFKNGLPEKIGGWILSSLGSSNGALDPEDSQYTTASASYILGATTISLNDAVTVSDDDPVWLFGDSKTGGVGTRSVSDALAVTNRLTLDADSAVTAAIGDALLIEYPNEFTTGDAIVSGGTVGSTELVLTTGVTTYLVANTVVTIELLSGDTFVTRLAATILSGETSITIDDPIPSTIAGGSDVEIYVQGSSIIDAANDVSYTVHILTAASAASVTIDFTPGLYHAANGLDIDITEYQITEANGDQTSTSSLLVDATTFAYSGGATLPAGSVVVADSFLVQTQFIGTSRALHDWVALDGEPWLAIGTDKKLYVTSAGELFDITPLRDSGSLGTNPFDTVDTSNVVTVNHTAHGESVGNYVRFTGATAFAGVDMNDEFLVQTVVDADSYTVNYITNAEATTSGGGASVSYEYDIDAGRESNTVISGWGTGGYGEGPYGTGEADVGIAARLRIWSLDNFGEDLLASPTGGALYHWDRTQGPTVRAVVVPNAPSTIQRMLISSEARHVICFGANPGSYTSPGVPDKLFIRWASQGDFSDWIPTSTNTAGDIRLDVGSEILTAVRSRGNIIVFTDESLHAMQYIAGNLVFSQRPLGQSVAVIGANGAVDANGIVFFMSQDDFLMYDGVLRVMDCPIRETVFRDFNSAQGDKCFVSVNKTFTEIIFFYPSASSSEPDKYAKYNYQNMVWDFGTINRPSFHDSSAFLGGPYGTEDGLLFEHENGVDETNTRNILSPMTSYIETWDMEIDGVGDFLMHVSEMIPDFERLTGSIDLTLQGRGYPQRAAISKGPFTVTSSTEKVDLRFKTRQVSYKIESDALGDDWRMGMWKGEGRPHGRRGA